MSPIPVLVPEALGGLVHQIEPALHGPVEVQLYDRLFRVPDPQGLDDLNPASAKALKAQLEPSLAKAGTEAVQFERHGYFIADRRHPAVFNRTVSLRDSWAKTGV